LTGVAAVALLALVPAAAGAGPAKRQKPPPYFVYDTAEQTIPATMLEGAEFYDPHVAATADGLWMTWLNFVPGRGDEIHVGLRGKTGWIVKETVSREPGRYAHPTLTLDAAGMLWLSYEAFVTRPGAEGRQWDVMVRPHAGRGRFGPAQRVSSGAGNDINHCVSPDPAGGLWLVWQADRAGQFDILARRVEAGAADAAPPEEVAATQWSEWHPSVAVGTDGNVYAAWDAYDGQSYNVLTRRRVDGGCGPVVPAASGPGFEGRAQVAAAKDGGAWILWERGAQEWGMPHRGMAHRNPRLSDSYGPLHRFRELKVGMIDRDGAVHLLASPLPMPSFAEATKRENSRKDSARIGVHYERGLLTVDSCDRPWVVYRHYYMPQASAARGMRSHVEQGWQLFARCLEAGGWSRPYAFDVRQRDGMQRLSVAATAEGLAAVWATGRTDRRKDTQPRGVALGLLSHPGGPRPAPALVPAAAPTVTAAARPGSAEKATVGGRTYRLFYGDLHRHTDLSLCFPFFDGSVDDAYRYAIDVARLDFLGITDHTRDINHGNVLSQLWWRCTKEVTRHRLPGRFFPMFTYERSMSGTDHNVITLRDDVLRDFSYPLTEFWKELDHDSFTVPHAPVNVRTWNFQDDPLRPLMEIYQGCRDHDSRSQAHAGLDKGYHLGFIASSDHVSTSASYACVWADEAELVPIFRSMQARRTFGATDKIRLVFRSGDRWMGERFTADAVPTFQIAIDGTAALSRLTVYDNGRPAGNLPLEEGTKSVRTTYRPGQYFTGRHYLYVHLVQADGNQAWSSPIWVTYDNPVKDPDPPKPKAPPASAAGVPVKLRGMTNHAHGCSVTTSFPDGITAGSPEIVTDGKLDRHLGHGTPGSAWAQVDLGRVRRLGGLRVWHYFRDGRTYRGNRLAVSATGEFAGEETVVFDSRAAGEYRETEVGRLFTFGPVDARYIRNGLSDNTSNRSTQWVEIEAYAPLPVADR
jgi:hypothetical protein